MKSIILATLIIATCATANAQERAFAMAGLTNSTVPDSIGTGGIGYYAGVALVVPVNTRFKIESDVYYLRQVGSTPLGNINTGWYNIAFAGNVYPTRKFHVGAGALIALAIHSKLRNTELERIDITGRAAVIGNIGYQFGRFDVVGRYDHLITGNSLFKDTFMMGVNYQIKK